MRDLPRLRVGPLMVILVLVAACADSGVTPTSETASESTSTPATITVTTETTPSTVTETTKASSTTSLPIPDPPVEGTPQLQRVVAVTLDESGAASVTITDEGEGFAVTALADEGEVTGFELRDAAGNLRTVTNRPTSAPGAPITLSSPPGASGGNSATSEPGVSNTSIGVTDRGGTYTRMVSTGFVVPVPSG